jgi:pimeloyl-ACP methyl ester carboxylesterase
MNTHRDVPKLAAVTPPVAVAGGASMQRPSSDAPKTYVLVHGAWHGGWCWSRVADHLRTAGHRVFTPTQTGVGERSHLLSKDIDLNLFVQDIENVIECEELSDVILVGHSFGGNPITGIADRIPQRLRHLVYLDAQVAVSGKSVMDWLPPAAAAARLKAAQEFDHGLSSPPLNAEALGVTDPGDVAWLNRRLTPHPARTYTTSLTLKNPPGNGIPKTFIRCTKPLYTAIQPFEDWIKSQSGWNYLQIATGHDAMVTAPQELVEMLLQIG